MVAKRLLRWTVLLGMCLDLVCTAIAAQAAPSESAPQNLFANGSFENGRDSWRMDRGGKTEGQFSVDDKDAAAGRYSALVTIGGVHDYGVQFGQAVKAPAVGKTYTFAAVAKSLRQPLKVRLEIERAGKPYDRAAASEPLNTTKDAWTELHVTFKVTKPFAEGWFAYVSCQQADAQFRADMFRLYEGEYVPYQKVAEQEAARVAVKLFDTGAASSSPLAGEAIARRSGWNTVPEDNTDHRFSGDTVVANDRLAMVLRRGAAGAELYSLGSDRAVLRAVLKPVAAGPVGRLASLAIVENGPASVVLDATFELSQGKKCGLRYELAMGQPYVQTEPREGATALSVEAPCRFVVLPDFFADDMVIDAAEIPVDMAELPSENFLLQMLPGRDAIVMTVASNRGQDARIELSGPTGPTDQRRIDRSETVYGPRGKIWVAVLQAGNIWHAREVDKHQAGKVLSLDWSAPLPALWRVDWRLPSGLSSSWEMAMQNPNGEFTKPGWFGDPQTLPATRKRWATVYGWYEYPCWIDGSGRGHLQPLARPDRLGGPALVYPINRVRETPLTDFTVVDVVRATLGVGPCEYILDVEGQGATMKGRATCGTRDALKAIYSAKQQKQKRSEVERILVDVVIFVKHIRSRINQYAEFGRQTVAYLQQQKKAHPELAAPLDELEASARAIEVAFAKRQHSIKEPQYVMDLTEKFRQTLLDYEGEDAVKKGLEITQAIVVVGGNQDELVGECRAAVKVLRQRAGLLMATQPNVAPIAREVRDRTQKALRNASSYEAPRH